MGSLRVVRPPETLQIRGLGSCVAIAISDPAEQVAGLAHAVVPRALDRAGRGHGWAAADAVPRLVEALLAAGARPEHLHADLAGGASMFSATLKGFQVGAENVEAAEAALAAAGIPVRTRHVGGFSSAAVRLDPATGTLDVERRGPPSDAPPEPPDDATGLLERALAPLATLTERTVTVRDAAVYDLTPDELADFFGARRTRLRGNLVALRGEDWRGHLAILLPATHAHRLAAALGTLAEEPAPPEEVLDEVLHIVTSHAVTALSGRLNTRILPGVPEPVQGPARRILRSLRDHAGPQRTIATLHGRADAEGLFHGADIALLLIGDAAGPVAS